jgi:predicted ATPase/class 3 adenylate cyclase
MSSLPSGTITFLFSDIEGSTQKWEHSPELMRPAFSRQELIMRAAMQAHGGYVYKMIGDAFQVAFAAAPPAVEAALEAQRALQAEAWGEIGPIRVRMALHTGITEERGDDYVGPLLNRVARLMSAGHGGQVLLTQATCDLVRDKLPEGASLRDMGERRLKDLVRPEHVYELVSADLPADFPPLKTLDAYPHNLPIQLTSFIGREKEIGELEKALSEHRLVTLTGSGGTGKTRLSLQVAAQVMDAHPDGVWFLELAPLTDPGLVPSSLAGLLGLRETAETKQPINELLSGYLRNRKALLVFDNCEHLIEACAKLADLLLRSCQEVTILATSREALGLPGELAWPVPSLSLPDMKQLPDIEQLSQYESVRLFSDRAVLVQPHFALTKDNALAVAQTCYRLDGIPLAIELAAARVKMISVEQIASRLDDRFRLLTGGSRTALPRQQTLRATIDWSYNLLSDPEKLLFRRLAVFMGGWTLELAEQVCSDGGIEPLEVLDLLGRLVDKSLVAVIDGKSGARYRILETVRQYAREKLFETDEAAHIRDQHLKAFLDLAEQAEPEIRSANQLSWLDRLDEEIDNLREALEWSSDREPEACLRLASALWRFWSIRAYRDEARDWLPRALSSMPGPSTVHRARALGRAAQIMSNLGHDDSARALANEGLALGTELGDPESSARALMVLGYLEIEGDHGQEGTDLLNRSLTLARSIGDHGIAASALFSLGAYARSTDLAASTSLLDEGLEEARLGGDGRVICSGLEDLVHNLIAQGRLEEAEERAKESILLAQAIGDHTHTVFGYLALSDIGLFAENYEAAEQYAKEAVAIARSRNSELDQLPALRNLCFVSLARKAAAPLLARSGEFEELARSLDLPPPRTVSLWLRGWAHLLLEDFPGVEDDLSETLAITNERKFLPGYMFLFELAAALAVARGRYQRGATLSAAAEQIRSAVYDVNFPIVRHQVTRCREEYLATALEHLGEPAFTEALARGRSMNLGEAVEYASKTTDG